MLFFIAFSGLKENQIKEGIEAIDIGRVGLIGLFGHVGIGPICPIPFNSSK